MKEIIPPIAGWPTQTGFVRENKHPKKRRTRKHSRARKKG